MKLRYLTYGLGLLALAGCSHDELMYSGPTSQGFTVIERENHFLVKDQFKVEIAKGDTTYVIYDYVSTFFVTHNEGVIDKVTRLLSDRDGVQNITSGSTTTPEGFHLKGKSTTLDKAVSQKSSELLKGRFQRMYDLAHQEAADSLKSRM